MGERYMGEIMGGIQGEIMGEMKRQASAPKGMFPGWEHFIPSLGIILSQRGNMEAWESFCEKAGAEQNIFVSF